MIPTRRILLTGACAFVVLGMDLQGGRAAQLGLDEAASRIAALETKVKGRLGVCVVESGTGRRLGYRADERFPMCSTFKLLLVAAMLKRVDEGRESLSRRLSFGTADLLDYAPVTKAHAAEGSMTVSDLCAAAIEWSDNTAANLLLASLGGPPAVTAFVRTLGDR